MHTQKGIMERFIQDLKEVAAEMTINPDKKDEGRVRFRPAIDGYKHSNIQNFKHV
jgi:hypothetical protein